MQSLLLLLLLLLAFTGAALEDREHWMNVGRVHLKNILSKQQNKNLAKNIIIFVGDGMGVATVTAARIFKGQQQGMVGAEKGSLVWETFPDVGLVKTYNVDKQVPDSAGTGTAIFTGVKTNLGVVGVDARVAKGKCDATQVRKAELESIFKWAQASGRLTGFVTTTRVTHATPSSTYGHTPHREWECNAKVPPEAADCVKDLARQLVEDEPGRNLRVYNMLEQNVLKFLNYFQVIFGGGLSPMGVVNYTGPDEEVCKRTDGRNLAQEWLLNKERAGLRAKFVQNSGELASVTSENDAVMGLFATNHMDYDAEREKGSEGSPSLLNMTVTALRLLKKGPNGFVLMVEGGLIDQAHHLNYARLALMETVGMEATVEAVLAMTSRKDTLVIVTADHSHTMTINGYPARGNDILGMAHNNPKRQPFETLTYANGPAYHQHLNNGTGENLWLDAGQMSNRGDPRYMHFAPIWIKSETHGGEDIAVYATGPFSHLFNGVHEQNYIAHAASCAGHFGPNAHLCKSSSSSHQVKPLIGLVTLSFMINAFLVKFR
ncbi:alkaline phosphatase 4-like [Neocloeon triangulifer]|uniref:alkaline phosphatase 4-like n=1 Tax=Neocloeon triangulifer TaxID=2078957 RepID=UPI00286F259B|nr:alkaline phosphatase 4-like [Neocloeon triangulifer]